MNREKSPPPPSSRRGVAFTLLTVFLAVAFTLFVAIPIVALLLYVPLGTLVDSLSNPVVTDAIRLSLITSTIATTIVIAFGTPLAFLNTRTDYPGRNLVETLTDLPIVLPPAVAGLGLLLAFGRYGLIGQYSRSVRDHDRVHDARGRDRPDLRRGPVLPPAGPDLLRRGRPSVRGRGPVARGISLLHLPPGHGPARDRGARLGRDHDLRPRSRRVRRDDHVRRQHPGEDADHAARDLQPNCRATSRPRSPSRSFFSPSRSRSSPWCAGSAGGPRGLVRRPGVGRQGRSGLDRPMQRLSGSPSIIPGPDRLLTLTISASPCQQM